MCALTSQMIASSVGVAIIIVAIVNLLNPTRWAFVFDQIRMVRFASPRGLMHLATERICSARSSGTSSSAS